MTSLSDLYKPFPSSAIRWRVGALTKDKDKCIPLAYIDARDVMERLDSVVGCSKWACRYPFIGCCELSIKIGNEWVTKSNCAGETNVEAEKGQASDAFKRAAVLWGPLKYELRGFFIVPLSSVSSFLSSKHLPQNGLAPLFSGCRGQTPCRRGPPPARMGPCRRTHHNFAFACAP